MIKKMVRNFNECINEHFHLKRLSDSKPKSTSGGYDRIFGVNSKIADLTKKVQSTVISNGTGLENIIIDEFRRKYKRYIFNESKKLDNFFDNTKKYKTGVYLATKKAMKRSKYNKVLNHEPDIVCFIIDNENEQYICNVIELKEGDDFDTKKSNAEKTYLTNFVKIMKESLSQFTYNFYICTFNSSNKKSWISKYGLKNNFKEDEILLGKELCEMLGINIKYIEEERQNAINNNIDYYFDELLNDTKSRNIIISKLKEQPEFIKQIMDR